MEDARAFCRLIRPSGEWGNRELHAGLSVDGRVVGVVAGSWIACNDTLVLNWAYVRPEFRTHAGCLLREVARWLRAFRAAHPATRVVADEVCSQAGFRLASRAQEMGLVDEVVDEDALPLERGDHLPALWAGPAGE